VAAACWRTTTWCELSASATFTQCTINVPLDEPVLLLGQSLGTGGFLGFTGSCESSGPDCFFIMLSPSAVTATFSDVLPTGQIVVSSVSPQGVGRVFSDGSIACDVTNTSTTGTCSETVAYGTEVTLQAVDLAGSGLFRRWGASSPCPGSTELSCTFTVNRATVPVPVDFREEGVMDIYLNAIGPNPLLQVSVSSDGFRPLATCSFSGTPDYCTLLLPLGLSTTITAVTPVGNELDLSSFACDWTGTVTSATCNIVLESDYQGFIFAFPEEVMTVSSLPGTAAPQRGLHAYLQPWSPRGHAARGDATQ
jgi:hypothetical protein